MKQVLCAALILICTLSMVASGVCQQRGISARIEALYDARDRPDAEFHALRAG